MHKGFSSQRAYLFYYYTHDHKRILACAHACCSPCSQPSHIFCKRILYPVQWQMTAVSCCSMVVCCDTPAEWEVRQAICKVTWLYRNQDVAIVSLHGVSKCHIYFSWLRQAIPLTVLQGISAQWRLLQAQSKCSVIHSGVSTENRQEYLFTLATGIHMNELLSTGLALEPESKQLQDTRYSQMTEICT